MADSRLPVELRLVSMVGHLDPLVHQASSRRPAPTPWRLALAGAGHVGSGLLDILCDRGGDLIEQYGADLRVTGVAEFGSAVIDPEGLDLTTVLATLRAGRALGSVPEVGRPGMSPVEMLTASRADILLEATPVNLDDGEPGLGAVRTALRRGTHVVLANKGPLALAYRELAALSDLEDDRELERTVAGGRRPRLCFSATVAGALPVINIGRRDLAGCRITRVEAVLNGTSQSIIRAMERGCTFADALADTQRRGIAEADPSLDVDGHDAACKLVIVANAVLRQDCTLADVQVEGIRGLATDEVRRCLDGDRRMVPLCTAELANGRYRLSVGPTSLPSEHPLSRLAADEMGVVYYADRVDRLSAASLEPAPEPASAAMLRDTLDIVRSEICPRSG